MFDLSLNTIDYRYYSKHYIFKTVNCSEHFKLLVAPFYRNYMTWWYNKYIGVQKIRKIKENWSPTQCLLHYGYLLAVKNELFIHNGYNLHN